MATKIDFGSDDFFINKYEELKSSRKMAQFYNCNKTTVLNHAKKIGYDVSSNKSYKLSEQDKKEIINNYNIKTSTQLAEKYGVSRGMITNLWYKAGLKGKETDNTNHMKNDLEGLKINNLTVIAPTEERDASGCVLWLCQCDCGQYIKINSSRLRKGIAKSCGCLSKKALENGRGNNFKDLTGQNFDLLTVIEQCQNKEWTNRSVVQWLCKCSCGRVIKVPSVNLLNKNTQSCGLCGNNSHGNIKIEKLLTEANIFFERQKTFDTCKDKNKLPFDFYVNNSYLIEYDGKQHFQKNSLFDYEGTHRRDLIKNQWCKDNNIPLIRIPYTHYNNLELKDLLLETSSFIV